MDQADWRIRFEELTLGTKIASGEFGAVYAGRFFGGTPALVLCCVC
jgi:hypothetical protein